MMRLLALLLIAVVSLNACATAAPAQPSLPYQLIIQFRTPVDDPASAAFVKQLSTDAGVTLRFVHTLAIGAQIYTVDGKLDYAEFSAVMQRLRQRPDVLYVEEDRRVQPALIN